MFFFLNSETTPLLSTKGKRKIIESDINKPVQLYNGNQPKIHIESYTITVLEYKIIYNTTKISTITLYNLLSTIYSVQFCHNLIENSFENGNSPCTQEFPEIRIKRQIFDFIKNIGKITSYYGIFTIVILPAQPNQTRHQIQTDDVYQEF